MNSVPPYTSLDMLRAMYREMYEDKWGPLGPYDGERRLAPRQEQLPDPIGFAMIRLRPIERMHALVERVVRFAGRPVDATTQSTITELAPVPDGVRDRCA